MRFHAFLSGGSVSRHHRGKFYYSSSDIPQIFSVNCSSKTVQRLTENIVVLGNHEILTYLVFGIRWTGRMYVCSKNVSMGHHPRRLDWSPRRARDGVDAWGPKRYWRRPVGSKAGASSPRRWTGCRGHQGARALGAISRARDIPRGPQGVSRGWNAAVRGARRVGAARGERAGQGPQHEPLSPG